MRTYPDIQKRAVPSSSLLGRYLRPDCYTDCYTVDIGLLISQPEYIEAFYTTWLFKLERFVLRYAVSKPSSDDEARELGNATTTAFAAWSVEARTANELLMCDFRGRTRSWLHSAPLADSESGTRLFFGSAVVTEKSQSDDQRSPIPGFGILIVFHKLYSRALLHATKKRLSR